MLLLGLMVRYFINSISRELEDIIQPKINEFHSSQQVLCLNKDTHIELQFSTIII